MLDFAATREWIDGQQGEMIRLVREWSAINSGTYHRAGVDRMRDRLVADFAPLGVTPSFHDLPPERALDEAGREVDHPLGQAISWRKRPEADFQVLFAIHYDTVFPERHPFQEAVWRDADTLTGPGVVDAKSGIAIIRTVVRALEASPLAEKIGWEIFLNSDEEIGSPGSAALLRERAPDYDLGLLFEPALPDGSLAGARKGSGNFSVLIRGRSAHVGREFHLGRSALHRAARLVVDLDAINRADDSGAVTVNVGKIDGGGPANVVADLAVVRFNVRVPDDRSMRALRARLDELVAELNTEEGYSAALYGDISSPPKAFEDGTAALFAALAASGQAEGVALRHKHTGGVCDGNKLAAAGLPNIDTLGGRGGGAHSDQEFLVVDSLTERARLVTRLLWDMAAGEVPWNWGRRDRR